MTLHEQRSRCRQTEKRRVRFHYGHTDINLYSYDMGTGPLLAHIDHYQYDTNNLNINSKLCDDVLDNVEVSGVSDVSDVLCNESCLLENILAMENPKIKKKVVE